MHTLAFDGRTGASGDMILAALVAAGADPGVLAPVEEALDVRYRIVETTKHGIAATSVEVLASDDGVDAETGDAETDDGDGSDPDRAGHDHDHDHDHDHHHDHSHDHEHQHDHDHDHDDHDHDHQHDHAHGNEHRRAEGAGPLRTYPEVVDIVRSMDLPGPAESDALATFELLGEAEATVHGTDLSDTHFHEVGADDAIADVVGAALLVDDLDPDRVVTTPVAAGGGEVDISHGTFPSPPPAVVALAEDADWTLRGGPVETELLTPTGAAILAHHAEGVDALPPMRVDDSGYGAGSKDLPERPNVLRALVGESRGGLVRDEIAVLETNLDDASPEVLGGLQETLVEAGARDVSIVPLTMKKSRPGHLVKVIAKSEDEERIARKLAEETGTLGVRRAGATHRWIAERRIETVAVEVDGRSHDVDVKVAADDAGEVYDVSAEYDDAAAVARETDLPVREVLRRAESAARES